MLGTALGSYHFFLRSKFITPETVGTVPGLMLSPCAGPKLAAWTTINAHLDEDKAAADLRPTNISHLWKNSMTKNTYNWIMVVSIG